MRLADVRQETGNLQEAVVIEEFVLVPGGVARSNDMTIGQGGLTYLATAGCVRFPCRGARVDDVTELRLGVSVTLAEVHGGGVCPGYG